MQDPVLIELILLTRRYRRSILGTAFAGALLAFLAGFWGARSFESYAVVVPAEIAPEGPVEDPQITADRLKTFIESKVHTGVLRKPTKLVATVVRDQPPTAKPMPLISLRATSRWESETFEALNLSIEEIKKTQDFLQAEERARLSKTVAELRVDLDRLHSAAVTEASQEAVLRVIDELASAERQLTSLRSHPATVLVDPEREPTGRGVRAVGFGVLGLAFGVVLGYVLALIRAGVRTVKDLTRPEGSRG